jgi:nicotinate-nucleotide pyrophosphorylase (carboxylating)
MAQIRIALDLGVGWLLLDHFRGARLARAMAVIRAHPKGRKTVIEVSGNVNARSIRSIAECGPDFVSSGSITHSAIAVDFSMTWK